MTKKEDAISHFDTAQYQKRQYLFGSNTGYDQSEYELLWNKRILYIYLTLQQVNLFHKKLKSFC